MINRKRADHILLKMVNYHSRDVHGNGIPDGNGNPMGMGQKNIISHGSGKGNGNNVDGNGNDTHSMEIPFPWTNGKRTVQCCQSSTLSLVESCVYQPCQA